MRFLPVSSPHQPQYTNVLAGVGDPNINHHQPSFFVQVPFCHSCSINLVKHLGEGLKQKKIQVFGLPVTTKPNKQRQRLNLC